MTTDPSNSVSKKLRNKLFLKNKYAKFFLAELFGTFLLITIGVCANAQYTFGPNVPSTDGTTVAWGLTVTMVVFVTGGVSGGHVNPAVSLAFFSLGQLKLLEMLVYWIAQYLGAFIGSACAYGIYYDALNAFDNGTRSLDGPTATAGIWATYPKPDIGVLSLFVDQLVGTMFLMLLIMAISDDNNANIPKGLRPICVGMAVCTVLFALSYNGGAAINPARDLGPRLFTYAAGWGSEVFTAYNYFFWIPLVATHIGAVIGAFVYQILVGWHFVGEKLDDEVISVDQNNVDNDGSEMAGYNKYCTSAVN